MADLPHQVHGPGRVRGEMQLFGADVNIAGQNIVHDDVFHEGATVVLFLVKILGVIQGHIGHGAQGPGHIILTRGENGVFKIIAAAVHRLISVLIKGNGRFQGAAHLQGGVGPTLTQKLQITAGNHAALRIDHAQNTTGCVLQLHDDSLENTVGHNVGLLYKIA